MEGSIKGLKIAWLLDDFPNPYQEYIKNLLQNLRIRHGIAITVIAYKLNRKNLTAEHSLVEVKVNPYLDEILRRLKATRLNRVERILAKYDIVHVQHSYLYPNIARLARMSKRPKLVITLRGADSYVKPWVSFKWRTYHKEISAAFAAIQVMSENQKVYLQKWGHKTERMHVIPISVGTISTIPNRRSISAPLKMYSVFRMVWEKNIELNLRVVKEFKKRGIDVVYDIYGDGIDMGQLYYLVNQFEMQDYVRIRGRVDASILAGEISNKHLLLQLSSSEALPASVIEALSMGIPCIVSSVGGLGEIIKTDFNGYLLDFNEHDFNDVVFFVSKLVTVDGFYEQLSAAAYNNYMERFAPNVESQRVIDMYNSILL